LQERVSAAAAVEKAMVGCYHNQFEEKRFIVLTLPDAAVT
jgi:hypothetical protein